MKVNVFIIFMVVQATQCDKATSKLRKKLIVPKMNDNCKKIKCASTEEPECVKLWRPDVGHTYYVNIVNKCELEYMKCHDGVEAKIVPMKYCGHGNGSHTANNMKNKTAQVPIRVKRHAISSESDDPSTAKNNEIQGASQLYSANKIKPGTHASKNLRGIKNKHGLKKAAYSFKPKDLGSKAGSKLPGSQYARYFEDGEFYSSGTDSDIDINERKKLSSGIAGYNFEIDDDFKPLKDDESNLIPKTLSGIDNRDAHIKKDFSTADTFPMISSETLQRNKAGIKEANKKEHEEMCPAVCASRDVMVCARCQHGIYKTFVSTCHMRIFSCNHNDEVLELVSRYPCVLSAPYLSEQEMIPKGQIVEETDDDKILRFIICRDKNQLQSEDIRCKFDVHKKLKYYDYKGVPIIIPSDHLIYPGDQ